MITLALAVLVSVVAQPMQAQTSTVFDPIGDANFNAPAFQDVVRGRMRKRANGDFHLLMEMAGPVPVAPTLPPQGHSEIQWLWPFDLDPSTAPQGYPVPFAGSTPEFIVIVSWDGTAWAGTAIDRRPLLTGGEAIITPVPFSIDGRIVEAVLPYALIGDVPASFRWISVTLDLAGPFGSAGYSGVDFAGAIFP